MVSQLRPMVQISAEYTGLLQGLESQRLAQQGFFAPGLKGEKLLPAVQQAAGVPVQAAPQAAVPAAAPAAGGGGPPGGA